MNTATTSGPIDAVQRSPGLATLTLAALGIVYGDIGTSPLYAVKETFNPAHGIPLTEANVIGGISAIFWALMIVVGGSPAKSAATRFTRALVRSAGLLK